MATIINNPPSSNDSGGPVGMIIVLVVVLVIGYLAFVYGLPALQSMKPGSPQINVPSKIDVNVRETN